MFWWWIFPAFFLSFLVVRLVIGPRWGWGWCGGWGSAYPYAPYLDPREELRQRLARGEITPEEYETRVALLR